MTTQLQLINIIIIIIIIIKNTTYKYQQIDNILEFWQRVSADICMLCF